LIYMVENLMPSLHPYKVWCALDNIVRKGGSEVEYHSQMVGLIGLLYNVAVRVLDEDHFRAYGTDYTVGLRAMIRMGLVVRSQSDWKFMNEVQTEESANIFLSLQEIGLGDVSELIHSHWTDRESRVIYHKLRDKVMVYGFEEDKIKQMLLEGLPTHDLMGRLSGQYVLGGIDPSKFQFLKTQEEIELLLSLCLRSFDDSDESFGLPLWISSIQSFIKEVDELKVGTAYYLWCPLPIQRCRATLGSPTLRCKMKRAVQMDVSLVYEGKYGTILTFLLGSFVGNIWIVVETEAGVACRSFDYGRYGPLGPETEMISFGTPNKALVLGEKFNFDQGRSQEFGQWKFGEQNYSFTEQKLVPDEGNTVAISFGNFGSWIPCDIKYHEKGAWSKKT